MTDNKQQNQSIEENDKDQLDQEQKRITKLNIDAYEMMKSIAYFQCLDTTTWKDPNVNIGEK